MKTTESQSRIGVNAEPYLDTVIQANADKDAFLSPKLKVQYRTRGKFIPRYPVSASALCRSMADLDSDPDPDPKNCSVFKLNKIFIPGLVCPA